MKPTKAVDYTFRVRYAETDQMGVVHNAVYLVWFEMGRTEYCIARGFPYSRIEEEGIILVVAESRIRYKKPAYYDEMLTVRTRAKSTASKVFRFEYQVLRPESEELIAEGETVHVALDRNTRRPTRLPQRVIDKLGPGE
jgi:acyl-CoA thioester hydrolase